MPESARRGRPRQTATLYRFTDLGGSLDEPLVALDRLATPCPRVEAASSTGISDWSQFNK
jgi:hypothetical protein